MRILEEEENYLIYELLLAYIFDEDIILSFNDGFEKFDYIEGQELGLVLEETQNLFREFALDREDSEAESMFISTFADDRNY